MRRLLYLLALPALLLLCACRARAPRQAEPWVRPVNDEIVICGRRVPIGAPVVLWDEMPAYDAYAQVPRFKAPSDDPKEPKGLRYQPGRVRRVMRENPDYIAPPPAGEPDTRSAAHKARQVLEREDVLVAPDARDTAELAGVVDQFVLHFDVCGISRSCFRVLHDERGLSVHFLLDIDGTLYQTLDLRETTWHATRSNTRSIGIEIANMGAYAPGKTSPLDSWYTHDAGGPYITIPERHGDGGVRTPGFIGRPARAERVRGTIQGDELEMHDFTPQQYDTLVKLTAALCRELPKIEPDAPRDASGAVIPGVLSDEHWSSFAGVLGHYHVQKNKNDPGPGFDWERFLAAVRARLAATAAP